MKIAAFLPLSLNEYPGHLSSIIFTQGCNFDCGYCHNPELKSKTFVPYSCRKKLLTVESIMDNLNKMKDKMEATTITGGEPLIQEGLIDFMKKIKHMGYRIKLNTNGSVYKVLKDIVDKGLVDLINMDIKATRRKYRSTVGVTPFKIDDIENSISLIRSCGVDYIFSAVHHDGLGDTDVEEIRNWVGDNNFELRENLI